MRNAKSSVLVERKDPSNVGLPFLAFAVDSLFGCDVGLYCQCAVDESVSRISRGSNASVYDKEVRLD